MFIVSPYQVLNFAFNLMNVPVFKTSKLLNEHSGFIVFWDGFTFDVVLEFCRGDVLPLYFISGVLYWVSPC